MVNPLMNIAGMSVEEIRDILIDEGAHWNEPGHLTHLGQLLRARGISTPILSHHMSNTSLLSLRQVFPQLQTLPSPS